MQDRLREYRSKRDFSRTAEPVGKRRPFRRGRRYVIQKHAARRLHYDFRLEHDGVLLSWAVPKGPSLDPADKRLAVRVEDHPLEYGSFEGTIPEGEYGGGTVMLWDEGTWEPLGDVEEGLAEGKLKFRLHGKRLTGGWTLVRLRRRRKRDHGDNWLLIKERDEAAWPNGEALLDRETRSVKSGRKMEEIAGGKKVWHSGRRQSASDDPWKEELRATLAGSESSRAAARGLKTKSRAARSKSPSPKFPAFVAPQLATLVDSAPAGSEWLHEIKYDGYRALAAHAGGEVLIRTRNGLDWTKKFAPLVPALSRLKCKSALIDGEIAVADAKGYTDFGALQDALATGRGGFSYYAFDLLHLDGKDLRARPLRERKRLLRKLLKTASKNGPLIYSDHVRGNGEQVFRRACELKLEGIVSKRAGDPYRSGRTRSWLKIKCGLEQEFVIIGWRPSKKAGRPFSSILLAAHDRGELRYCGRVGAGYSDARLDDLAAAFRKYARRTPPVQDLPQEIAREARFVEPVLVAEIAFRGWTRDNLIRQGSFKGLRADKPARAVIRERPMPAAKAAANPSGRRRNGDSEIAGVRVSHPDRVLFEERSITKRQLIDYYLAVADVMLPYIVGRPLALVRCPDGSEGERFFQKHATAGWPREFKRVRIREKSGTDEYLYIEDERGLVAAAQMSVLELHIWGSRADRVEQPDRMVFDLDPDEGLPFAAVVSAARELRQRLERLALQSFPLVTGGKGIHVVVPLAPGHGWDDHRHFAEALARVMAEDAPDRYVASMSKVKRHGKIFIDYLRNQRGATAIAPYSSRARRQGFVAWPVSWQGLARLDNAHPVTVATAAKFLSRRDPWAGYAHVRQVLPINQLARSL
ncbi:MAG TPA: DNA ligase D [Xanthobacteraceae bacterium]|nr:DNA ligase D [Xanthobacteraceae bacterium]